MAVSEMRVHSLITLCAFVSFCTVCCSVNPEARTNTASQNAAPPPSSGPERVGSGYSTAIFIAATNEGDGVRAEYDWIRDHLLGSHATGQLLSYHNGKPYDIVHVESAAGEKADVYFDVSSFYGKRDGGK
jgi:hypothetical protein